MNRDEAAVDSILTRVPLRNDSVLIVHSAFRTLAREGHRVEGFIDALRDRLGNRATLLMPAMTWRTVTPSQPVFDELATASHVGVMAETFRVSYATHRSLHPTHSVSGLGPAAGTLLAKHHVDDTPVSGNSPYGLAREYDAHILMLGVGLESVTAIHNAEETIAPDLYLRPAHEAETYTCRDRHGHSTTVRLRRHYRLNRDFPQFEPPLAGKGRLLRGEIAGTPWMVTSLRDLLEEVFQTLVDRPDAIIAARSAGGTQFP